MKAMIKSSLRLSLLLLTFYSKSRAQICSFNLGNDTSICQGTPINFNLIAPTAPVGFTNTYLWDNAATTISRNVSNYGTYYCRIAQKGINVVNNGDFNGGNTGFTSGYTLGTGGTWGLISNPGTYVVTTNTSLAHNNFVAFPNHGTAGGKMLVVNGSSTANVDIWCQNITVSPNTDYNFSTWVTSCENGQPTSQLAILQFSINGSPLFLNGSSTINTFSPTNQANTWVQFNASWNSGPNTNASICIVNQNTNAAGNDFALDDIFFQPVCSFTDTLKVTSKPIPTGQNAGSDQNICSGQSTNLNGNAGNATQFSWSSFPAGFTSTQLNPTVSPTDTTKYILTVDLNGCKKRDTTVVEVILTPVAFAGADKIICDGQIATLNGNAGGGANFFWSSIPPGFNSSQINPDVTPLLSTKYVLTSANGSCQDQDTAEVTVNTAPTADFSYAALDSSCNSYSLSFHNNSSNALTYFWDFDDGFLSSDQDPIHSFTNQAIYQVKLIAKNAGCESVKIVPLKISFSENSLFIPNGFTPNNDLKNDSFYIPKGCLQSIKVQVYDRWGQLAKSWEGLNDTWDGKINGAAAPAGVYVFILDGFFLSGERVRKRGTITLYR